jgi:hypothetical protein
MGPRILLEKRIQAENFPKNRDFKTPELQRPFCDYDVQCLHKHLKFDQVLWAETFKETSDPWPCLMGPVDIDHLKNKYGENMKISGRFGLIKDNSVRLIDNLKSSEVNKSVSTTQKLCLSTFDTLLVLAARLKLATGQPVNMLKRDQKKTY